MRGLRGGPAADSDPEEVQRAIRYLVARLDPWTYFVARPHDAEVDAVVVGASGAFVIRFVTAAGYASTSGDRLRIDARAVLPLRRVRAAAKRARSRLLGEDVFTEVEPIVCPTRAQVGGPPSGREVRVIGLEQLAGEIAARPRSLTPARARKGASVLGTIVASGQGGVSATEEPP